MIAEDPELQALRAAFERLANDSMRFKRSRKGTYINPSVARDWKWFQLGHQQALHDLEKHEQ